MLDPKKADQAKVVLEAFNAEYDELVDRLKGSPQALRVAQALAADPLNETERKLVQVLLDRPGSTSEELSQHLDWGGQSWHMHFGKLCEKRQARLWPAEYVPKRRAYWWCGILTDYDDNTGRFTMKPEVIVGLAEHGIVAQDAT